MTFGDDLTSSLFDLENRIFYRFSLLVGRHVRYFSEKHIKKHKLSTQGWLILTVIGRFTPLSPSEVADHTSVGRDKISRIVDQLVANGLVVRRTDEQDRRRIVLTLSAKGKRVFEDLELVARRIEADVLGELSAPQRQAFADTLARIETGLGSALEK
jgi:DNA-binding MarR family transcriptional regulator